MLEMKYLIGIRFWW